MLVPRPGGGQSGQGLPSPWQLPRLSASLGFALGFAASVIATMLAWLLGAARDPAVALMLFTVTAGAVGAVTTPVGALTSATQCWAFYTGFLLNGLGVLTFDHRSLAALAVIVLAGVAPSLLLTAARRLHHGPESVGRQLQQQPGSQRDDHVGLWRSPDA